MLKGSWGVGAALVTLFCTSARAYRVSMVTGSPSGGASAAAKPKERVVICGGGIIGASIAYQLTLRGYEPVVIEREEIAAAASGKAGGFLAK